MFKVFRSGLVIWHHVVWVGSGSVLGRSCHGSVMVLYLSPDHLSRMNPVPHSLVSLSAR